MYRTTCPSCKRSYDATRASDCNCLVPARSFLCPYCGACFCSAPTAFKDAFWRDAPAELRERSRRRAAAEPNEVVDASLPVVLFADDDPTARAIAQQVIRGLGYSVVVAGDGEEALTLARQYRPELVITDALMPRRDGREVAKIIKRELPGTRVVVITSIYKDARYKHEAYREFEVDEYLTKPVAPGTLRDVVQRWIRGADA